jgi:hypothetical protein
VFFKSSQPFTFCTFEGGLSKDQKSKENWKVLTKAKIKAYKKHIEELDMDSTAAEDT